MIENKRTHTDKMSDKIKNVKNIVNRIERKHYNWKNKNKIYEKYIYIMWKWNFTILGTAAGDICREGNSGYTQEHIHSFIHSFTFQILIHPFAWKRQCKFFLLIYSLNHSFIRLLIKFFTGLFLFFDYLQMCLFNAIFQISISEL